MGLDTTHDCWHGAYTAFHRWRCKLAEVAGLPPLDLMEGFYQPLDSESVAPPTLYHGPNTYEPESYMGFGSGRTYMSKLDDLLPIKWECLKPNPLHELLCHSDCDGEIPADRCGPIANALEELIPLLPDGDAVGHIGNWREKTQAFVGGLRRAAAANENVKFH